jgi:hypothetical protein
VLSCFQIKGDQAVGIVVVFWLQRLHKAWAFGI